MKTHVTYGFILALCNALFALLLFFTGYQTEKLAAGRTIAWLGLVIFIVVLYLGMKAVRDARPGQAISYGGAVGAAVLIALFGGIFGGIYTYIHFTFVNPHFSDYVINAARQQMENAGKLSDAQIDSAMKFTGFFTSAPVQAVSSLIFSPIMGALAGLILAIFVKRPALEPPAVAEPPAAPAA